jgi:cytochrome P450
MSQPPASSSPAPLRLSPLTFLWKRRRPLAFMSELAATSPDLVVLQVAHQRVALLKHPSLVQQLLVTDTSRTEKGRTAERELFFSFLGDGLLNIRGEPHRRQRRLMLPGFHHSRLRGYGQTMVDAAANAAAGWQDGEVRDITTEMMVLSLAVAGRTLFSADTAGASQAITAGFDELTQNVNRMLFPGARWLLRSPLPFARRLRTARQNLDAAVYALIHARRAQGTDTGDLLSMLLLAEDAEHLGERLSDVEVRDQVMTLLFTGQDPIGNTLAWTWWLLARHPAEEAALHAELIEVLGGRPPAFDDFPKLVVTERIVREVLRLYPALWTLGRRATENLTYAGHALPTGTLLVASQWIVHRDARWFPDPADFRPSRWTAEFRAALPRYAYFPFGGGARSCVAENFAWMELVLIVATLAQRWRFTLTPAAQETQPQARITLHPDRPVPLRFTRRAP